MARLRLIAAQARLTVDVLGGRELAAEATDLALAIARLTCGELVQHAVIETFRGAHSRGQCVRPGSDFEHLRAVDLAQSVVLHHRGLAVTPSGQRLRPLPGVREFERVLTERERVAVDDPGDDWGRDPRTWR